MNVLLVLVVLGVSVPRALASNSCGLCLHSGEDCPYPYDGFSGLYCGMFEDSMGFSTACCCPNTMVCAATATTCGCTQAGQTTSPPATSSPPSATTTPTSPASTSSGNSSKDDSGSLSGTAKALIGSAAGTFATGIGAWAVKKCTGERSSGGDATPSAKVENAAKYEIKCDNVMITNINHGTQARG